MTRARDVADTQDNIGGAVPPFAAGKNKIMNGNMAISQKGVGPFSISINSVQTLDRWRASGWSGGTETGVASIEQSTDAPSGFTNSLKLTVTTADASLASTDTYGFLQAIEANNIQPELEYGTGNAKTIAVSFWVKGSVAGPYGAAWQANGAAYGGTGWAYVFSFPVTTSWSRVSVIIPGLTTGGIPTFLSTGPFGFLRFDIGSGTTFNGTLNAWQTGNIRTFAGATAMISTSGATLNLTGVQLEFGNVITPFTTASGSIGGELALCQRYYERWSLETSNMAIPGFNASTTNGYHVWTFHTKKRAEPTVSVNVATDFSVRTPAGNNQCSAFSTIGTTTDCSWLSTTASSLGSGNGNFLVNSGASSFIQASSEI